jgi:mono/diheme cytochrome c family protein
MNRYTLISSFLVVLLALCCTPRRLHVNLAAEHREEDPRVAAGRLVFKNHCQKCHPDGEAGEGPAINPAPLPGIVMRYRVRSRSIFLWMGKMPSFKRNELSRKEMNDLIAFIKHMKRS